MKTKSGIISPQQWGELQETLERAEAYVVLRMRDEAIHELRSVPNSLQDTLPFLLTAVRVCVQFSLWENVASLCITLLDEHMDDDRAIDLAAAAAQILEEVGQAQLFMRFATP